jgi:FMN-dependent NADH-azoreductase
MPNLLHIDSSIRPLEQSRSRQLSKHYSEAWAAAHPDGTVTYRDLSADPPPHVSWASFSANLTPPEDRTSEQSTWRELTELYCNEVLAADDIVVGMGLYNFGIPSTIKAWFDRIVVPGLTMGPDGGLLGGKKLTFTAARGGGYGEGTPREGWDHREPWLLHAFEHLGLTDVRFIHAELTLARESPAMIPLDLGDAEDKSLADAHAEIDALFSAASAA